MVRGTQERRWCFLTDGGHCENLGLGPLLARRCRLIVVADASDDPEGRFNDLLRIYRRARTELGIRFSRADGEAGEMPLQQLLPEAGAGPVPLSRVHYFLARIDYPDGFKGHLVYVKPSLTGDEASDLVGYRHDHPEFPNDPTLNQFFDEDQFESYRQLGQHIGEQLCSEFLRGWYGKGRSSLWDEKFALEEGLQGWLVYLARE
jgi:hypothetical protein